MANPPPQKRSGARRSSHSSGDDLADLCRDLSYNQARTALDLTIARLQSSELEVEEMTDLYRRAMAYAERCQQVLETVQQEVVAWESGPGNGAGSPTSPEP